MNDIHRYGNTEGVRYYWTLGSQWGSLSLVAIDGLGQVTQTGAHAPHDPAAMTIEDAVLHRLEAGIAEADAELAQRRAEAPEEPQGPEEPLQYPDPATERFFSDD